MSHDTKQSSSNTLLAAQQRLLELRAALPPRTEQRRPQLAISRPRPELVQQGQALLLERRRREVKEQGVLASDALKVTVAPAQPAPRQSLLPIPPANKPKSKTNVLRTVKVYPSLATGMLKAGLAAPGRVYWLLRFLDSHGRGWLTVNEVRAALATKKSELRICGWRRLRQILNEGERILWERDEKGRLWLYGAAKTALRLGTARLQGHPVSFPIEALLGSIKTVKAHFYASFHSGRKQNNPISRQKLEELTGVPERTQREYDQVANVGQEKNIAIGERYTKANVEERAWRQGRGVFQFVDVEGQQGKKNGEYVAWRLPNSYTGPHSRCSKGRQKKINQELIDLVMKGMRGNSLERVERIFWPHGAAAGRAYNRDQAKDAYWSSRQTRAKAFILWNVLVGAGG